MMDPEDMETLLFELQQRVERLETIIVLAVPIALQGRGSLDEELRSMIKDIKDELEGL